MLIFVWENIIGSLFTKSLGFAFESLKEAIRTD